MTIADEQAFVPVDPDWLQQVAAAVLQGEGVVAAEISIALVDDATIHRINRQFLNHDDPTDVISFLLSEPSLPAEGVPCGVPPVAGPRPLDGEIVVSGETAARCAAAVHAAPRDELALYLVHGLLHLCGYDDQTEADRQTMRLREQTHLQKFGICPHYDD